MRAHSRAGRADHQYLGSDGFVVDEEGSATKAHQSGPYSWVKHPLYTGVALWVLPWIGFPLNTWVVGALIGVALYAASGSYASAEEASLSKTFGVKRTPT